MARRRFWSLSVVAIKEGGGRIGNVGICLSVSGEGRVEVGL